MEQWSVQNEAFCLRDGRRKRLERQKADLYGRWTLLIDKAFKQLLPGDWQSDWRTDEQVIAVLYYLCINTNALNRPASLERDSPQPRAAKPNLCQEEEKVGPQIAVKCVLPPDSLNTSGTHIISGGGRPEVIPGSLLICARSWVDNLDSEFQSWVKIELTLTS